MKVIHLLNGLKYSGAEKMLLDAKSVFESNKVETIIISVNQEKGAAHEIFEENFATKYIKYDSFIRKIIVSPSTVLALVKQLSNFSPDVVHIHAERANFIFCLVALLANAKVVRTVHHVFPPSKTCMGVVVQFIKIFQRFLLRSLGVVFVSNSNYGFDNERTAYLNTPLCLIPNWIGPLKKRSDRNRGLVRQRIGLSAEVVVLLSVGGAWPYKNQDLIILSLPYLPSNFVYLRLGENPKEKFFRDLALEYGVYERYFDFGAVPDISDYLDAADVFVMPSSLEGFGNAGLEALEYGLPCVFGNRPALNEFKPLYADRVVLCELTALAIADGVVDATKLGFGMRKRKNWLLQGCEKYIEIYGD